MADILYTYNDQVYANITNKCDCACRFCIRSHMDTVGDAQSLWHEKDPSLKEVTEAMDRFDLTGYRELVYCGYGEPTCALDVLIGSARYAKETYGIRVRINTNGLANLYHGRDVIPELAEIADSLSVSLNAPTAEQYEYVTRPRFPGAFEALKDFVREAKGAISEVKLSIVDVLSEEEQDSCRKLAASLGVPLRIRSYV